MRENIFIQLERLFNDFVNHRMTKVDFYYNILALILMADDDEKKEIKLLFSWLKENKSNEDWQKGNVKYEKEKLFENHAFKVHSHLRFA